MSIQGCSLFLHSYHALDILVAFIAFEDHIAGMTALTLAASGKKSPPPSAAPTARERSAAARIVGLLSVAPTEGRSRIEVIDGEGERAEMPEALTEILYRAAELVAAGHLVAIMPDEEILSSQEAADLLNVSRQYLVRLVDSGELPAQKVGTHRRLRVTDVLAFKSERDAKRTKALDRLTALSEDAGGYVLGGEVD
jgi:excisionase family DNA binding protein